MSEEPTNAFSEFSKKDKKEESTDGNGVPENIDPQEPSVEQVPEQTPQEPIDPSTPHLTLNDEQKLILSDLSQTYEVDIQEINHEFNKAYLDSSLDMFTPIPKKKFTLAKAMMKSVLDEKAKINKYNIMPIGKGMFLTKAGDMILSNLVGIIKYPDEIDGKDVLVEKIISIQTFDREGQSSGYKSLHEAIMFYTYDALMTKKKSEFALTDYTTFEIGTPPEGNLANFSDLELYAMLGIVPWVNIKGEKIPTTDKTGHAQPYDDIVQAKQSKRAVKSAEDNTFQTWADATDLKALNVLIPKPNVYKAKNAEFKDVLSVSANGIDFAGNPVTLYLSSFTDILATFSNMKKGDKAAFTVIGNFSYSEEKDQWTISVLNILPYEQGEE